MSNDPYAGVFVEDNNDAGTNTPAAVAKDPYAGVFTPEHPHAPFTNLTAEAYAGRPVPGTLLGDLNRDGKLNVGEGILAVGRQVAYGVKADLPRMLGDAMKYVSEPGGYFYDTGKQITDWVDQQERDNPDLLFKYEWDKNPVVHVLGGGARMIPMSLGPPHSCSPEPPPFFPKPQLPH